MHLRFRYLAVLLVLTAALAAQPAERPTADTWPDGPPPDDLALLRTALPYPARRRAQSTLLLYNVVEWSPNENFQVGVGNALLLGLLTTQRYRTTLSPGVHLGIGNRSVLLPQIDYGAVGVAVAGDAAVLLTLGTPEQFYNLGVGVVYTVGYATLPAYRVGLGTRLGPRVAAFGELVAVSDADAGQLTLLPSLNVGLAGRRHRWSFGVAAAALSEGDLYPFPYLSYWVYF
ncbi:hypothetical protein [Lewinella sp. IMCC34183]|uniref:hypothetical protein n=1 Tax=Lewinella sp. IMCC34183 TaxID=2248762 RepID=UPI000E289CFF|nr:hypothetical protein [Lewinella sp. IMCC34183]